MHSRQEMALAATAELLGPSDLGPRVESVAKGLDLPSFEAIYETHVPIVWRTLRRFGVPDAALEDACQDVFVVVHSRLESFEGRSSLKTWLFGIARRVARNYRRGAKSFLAGSARLNALTDVMATSSPGNTEQLEQARWLEHLLGQLHPDKREAFILVDLEGMTAAEASEALGLNPNTLYSRLRAARAELELAVNRAKAQDSWRTR